LRQPLRRLDKTDHSVEHWDRRCGSVDSGGEEQLQQRVGNAVTDWIFMSPGNLDPSQFFFKKA
jgi:hypothetical protein